MCRCQMCIYPSVYDETQLAAVKMVETTAKVKQKTTDRHRCCRSCRMTLLPNGTLKIANATRQDAGSYTCVAKNQFGTASTTGKLLITGESGAPGHLKPFCPTSGHVCTKQLFPHRTCP